MTIDTHTFVEAICAGHRAVERNKAQMNALNVFPVPDGDTGTNMALTLESITDGVNTVVAGPLSEVTSEMARSALMGARGNSGLILSQFFAGIAEATIDSAEFGSDELVRSLNLATDAAYSAVQNPTEGTMLTVLRLSRDAAAQAANGNQSLIEALSEVAAAAHAAVEDTPNLLDVLAAAGVVDSGGYGIFVIFAGALSYLNGESNGSIELPAPGVNSAQVLTDFLADAEEESWGYCTVFLLTGEGLDPAALRASIGGLGRSAVVAGSATNVKVHVHVDNPGPALELAANLGTLSNITIMNMDEQTADRVADQDDIQAAGGGLDATCGIVSIVDGDGMRRLFIEGGLGAVEVVTGGDSMNPSVAEILEAVGRCPQTEVVILPNNSNVIGTANQAASESSKEVAVVPTKSMQAGVSALLAYSPQLGADENQTAMDAAASDVVVGSVTIASRDFDLDGENVGAGAVIGILGSEIVVSGDDLHEVALGLLARMSHRGELLTIYRGEAIDQREAEELGAAVSAQFGRLDVEILDGGQPHYPLLIAVE
jgi:DAK2 domain fusion protein YloV